MGALRKYWLMKSEPDEFGIEHLAQRKREPWSGVRNFQARNFMKEEMQVGDGVLFYHSSTEVPGVYGLAVVASQPYPDPTQFDPRSDYYDDKSRRENPRWYLVDVGYDATFAKPVTLEAMRVDPALADMITLRRGNRLSITPVTEAEYEHIVALADKSKNKKR